MAVSPSARTDVLRWLGLESVEIKREVPRPRPGASLQLGTPTTVEALRVPVLVPKALGEPDAYKTTLSDGTVAASLVYPGPVLVQTFKASARRFIEKSVASADAVEEVRVDGKPGYFITGAHGFAYESGPNVNYEDQRIAGNTLLLEVRRAAVCGSRATSPATVRWRSRARLRSDDRGGAEGMYCLQFSEGSGGIVASKA